MRFDTERARRVAESFDLKALETDFYASPFPYYHALREHAPVKRMPDASYLLTRYADVEYVYKNPKLFSSDKQREFKPKYGDSLLYEHHTTSPVFYDESLETRVRRLIAGALTPRRTIPPPVAPAVLQQVPGCAPASRLLRRA